MCLFEFRFLSFSKTLLCLHFSVLQGLAGYVNPFWVASSVHKALILSRLLQILYLNGF